MTRTVGTLIQMDFDDLTDEQVLALTPVELQFHTDRLMARDGVPLPVVLPPKPTKAEAQPDIVVYKVGEEMFTDHADAVDVRDMINNSGSRVKEDYVPGGSYRDRAVKRDRPDQIEVVEARVWSEEGWAKHGAAIKAATAAREAWDTMEKEAKKADEDRQRCRDHVNDRRHNLEIDAETRARWSRELDRYADLGLAPTEARAALLLAHPTAEDWLPPVVPQDAAQCDEGAADVERQAIDVPGYDEAMDGPEGKQ